MVTMKTTFGEIRLALDEERAPKTVANFLAYARAGHYDGTIFHRVIDNFMVQGGGFDTNMQQKPAESRSRTRRTTASRTTTAPSPWRAPWNRTPPRRSFSST